MAKAPNLDYISASLRPLAQPLHNLHPDQRNARRHDERNIDAIADSLRQFGQQKPIVVQKNGKGFNVLAGNGTLRAALKLGWTHLAAAEFDRDDTGAAVAFGIADNRTAELAEWDAEMVAGLLEDLAGEYSPADLGFTNDELDGLLADEPREVVEDEVPEPPADPITKPGDLIILGDHRLLCGDSTKAADVGRLMDGAKAQMMFTDPPYGVNYEGGHFHSGDVNIKRKREKLAADATAQIYFDFLPVALSVVDGPCYMWFADSKARDIYNAVHDCGCDVHALIIWHKTNATYAAMNAQYKQRHEPCLYFKPKGSTLRWCGETTEATVWSQDRDGINEFHPTQKPVALAAKAIGNHEAANVLDMFCGSGSTLIAAEQLGRKCYGMDISPAYCDVIVERWQNLTGGKATRG